MTKEELFEKLAATEHQRWADWQQYVFDKCFTTEAGIKCIPADFVTQWQHQIETPYESLSEEEKEKDREQVRRYWYLIENL